MTIRAGVYARISKDKGETRVGVDRQLGDGEAIAGQLGWAVVGRYVDNDTSARDGKIRAEFERMLRDVEAGRLDAVIGWDDDRLRRTPDDGERLIRLAKTRSLRIATRHGEQKLDAAHGQLTARIKTAVADYEVTQMGERIQRALRDRAERGLPHSICPWGWTREYDRDEYGRVVAVREPLHPVNGPAVREAAERLIAGDSLRGIAADFQRRGIPTPQQQSRHQPRSAARWDATALRRVLRRARNAGLRVHQGQVIGAGVYEAAYDVATHERVQAILDDPARRTSMANGRARYLLSGVARCGACQEAAVNVLPSASGGRRYGCPRCFGVGRSVEFVDALVVAVLMRMLAAPDAAAALGRPDDDAGREAVDAVTTLRDRLDRAADQYADGVIDAQQLARITGRLRPELERAERTVRDRALAPDLAELAGPGVEQRWELLSLDRQRAVVRYLLEVTILPMRGKRRLATEFIDVQRRRHDRV